MTIWTKSLIGAVVLGAVGGGAYVMTQPTPGKQAVEQPVVKADKKSQSTSEQSRSTSSEKKSSANHDEQASTTPDQTADSHAADDHKPTAPKPNPGPGYGGATQQELEQGEWGKENQHLNHDDKSVNVGGTSLKESGIAGARNEMKERAGQHAYFVDALSDVDVTRVVEAAKQSGRSVGEEFMHKYGANLLNE